MSGKLSDSPVGNLSVYAVLFLLFACSNPSADPEKYTITVTPSSLTLAEGRGTVLRASTNAPLDSTDRFLVWNPGGGIVGLDAFPAKPGTVAYLSARMRGTDAVRVNYNLDADVSTTVPVTVLGVSVKSITLSPGNAVINVDGPDLQVQSYVKDSVGVVLWRDNLAWNSSDTTVAVVSGYGTGVVRGVKTGEVTISASLDGVTGYAHVIVRP